MPGQIDVQYAASKSDEKGSTWWGCADVIHVAVFDADLSHEAKGREHALQVLHTNQTLQLHGDGVNGGMDRDTGTPREAQGAGGRTLRAE